MKTSELQGTALDWAVAKCEGELFESSPTKDPQIAKVWPLTGMAKVENGRCIGYAIDDARFRRTTASYADEGGIRLYAPVWRPSTDWALGGPIIEREKIRLDCAWNPGPWEGSCKIDGVTAWTEGPTPLIAAMRCYVASKLGDEVEIPKELQ